MIFFVIVFLYLETRKMNIFLYPYHLHWIIATVRVLLNRSVEDWFLSYVYRIWYICLILICFCDDSESRLFLFCISCLLIDNEGLDILDQSFVFLSIYKIILYVLWIVCCLTNYWVWLVMIFCVYHVFIKNIYIFLTLLGGESFLWMGWIRKLWY